MAIKIPSKYIYDIDFNPVIDNNVGYINITANKVVPDNKYKEPVYNFSEDKDITSNDGFDTLVKDYRLVHYLQTSTGVDTILASVLGYRTRYNNITISFPKKYNEFISKVYDKLNDEGEPNVKLTLYLNKYIGSASGNIAFHVSQSGSSWNYSVYNISLGGTSNKSNPMSVDSDANPPYGIPQTMNYAPTILGYTMPNISFSYTDETNIKTQPIIYDSETDSYTATFKILTDLRVYSVDGRLYGTPSANQDYEIGMVGEITDYLTSKIELTVYGDSLSIDLQDKTIQVGNGDTPYSFDGNELIQTTNTPSIDDKYQTIIDEWKDGKQSAVISCPIADYYDTDGNTAINTTGIVKVKVLSKSGNNLGFQELGTRLMQTGLTTITLGNRSFTINVAKVYDDYSFDAVLVGGNIQFLAVGAVCETMRFLKRSKLMFSEGDIVIPYVYTNKGDRPLSYNRDFSAKKFKVVGTQISTKQGVTQQLTLLEA